MKVNNQEKSLAIFIKVKKYPASRRYSLQYLASNQKLPGMRRRKSLSIMRRKKIIEADPGII